MKEPNSIAAGSNLLHSAGRIVGQNLQRKTLQFKSFKQPTPLTYEFDICHKNTIMVSDAAAALAVATSPETAGKKLESKIHKSQLKPLQDKLDLQGVLTDA